MTDDILVLQPSVSARKNLVVRVPGYDGITYLSVLLGVIALLAWIGSGLLAIYVGHEIITQPLAAIALGSVAVLAVILFLVATACMLLAYVAIAVRDSARNSFCMRYLPHD